MGRVKPGKRGFGYVCIILLASIMVFPINSFAGKADSSLSQGQWWDIVPEEENPSEHYDSLLYFEIGPTLREIEKNSNRVKVDVIGQSAEGRDLFLVTLSAPEAMGRLGKYQAIRNTMLKDPAKAQAMIDKFGDFKVPVFINGSIHGDEYPGVDAAIRLIKKLAYGNSPEVKEILKNIILLVNVVQNPDGRVMGTRRNANGFDINRDFIAQTQPETKTTIKIFTEWNPMVVLDLHGFVNPMLIEPCTPPHNPNYEYDLYIKWAFEQALAMEAELISQTDEIQAIIPYREWDLGWDDWAPSYTPMYAMFHGAYGHTLETPYRDASGVDAHYAAVWGALKYVAENRQAMVHDQIEIFRRGFLDLPQMLIPDEFLNVTQWNQFNEMTIQDFPAGYVIPPGPPFQVSEHNVAKLIEFLLFNDVQVEKTNQSFVMNGIEYPSGSYVVWMNQPKRGLANTFLEDGPDLSSISGLTFYSPPAVWSHPLLWGVRRAVLDDYLDIKTNPINAADIPKGSSEGGSAAYYTYALTSIEAFKATNDLLEKGTIIYRSTEAFIDEGRSFGAGSIIVPANPALGNELADGYALDIMNLGELPEDIILMQKQRLAVYGDEGVSHALRQMEFQFDELSVSDIEAGEIANYDIFINLDARWSRLNDTGKNSMKNFFEAGGNYIGFGYRGRGIQFALDAEIIDADYYYEYGNAIVILDFDIGSPVAAGFWPQDFAFVYYPGWFTRTGNEVKTVASYKSNEFLISGYWPDWQSSNAGGKPVIVHAENGTGGIQDTVLIGIDNTFRGHPENTFRILGNAIYSCID